MPESNLSLAWTDFQLEVGNLLGFGVDTAAWSTAATNTVERVVQHGYRQFLTAHPWTFLKPPFTITLLASIIDYQLPEDFGGLEGVLTVKTTNSAYAEVPVIGEGLLREKRSLAPTAAGRPLLAAVRPMVHVAGAGGQRFEFMIFPKPDARYSIEGRYYVLPQKLSSTNNYPYGGMLHGQTILESCLAKAEAFLEDQAGIHAAEYQKHLAISIAIDGRQTRGDMLGYVGDNSDERSQRFYRDNIVTYNSVEY